VAFSDEAKNGRAAVRTLIDTSWVSVGLDNPSGSMVFYTALAMDMNGTLFIGYMDSKNYPGVNQYWHRGMVLKYQIDPVKVSTVSPANSSISIYPNPTNDFITIDFPDGIKDANVTVKNELG
jgi:hypothetical protein